MMLVLLGAAPAGAAGAGNLLSLEELLDTYRADAEGQPSPQVAVEGWVERADDGQRELVIVLAPEGKTKLNADPGITVTPAADEPLSWQVALPHRHTDPSIDYFQPSATVRMPFAGDATGPIRVVVEFAYCVVDYQCFFGEEELTVANLVD
jgi:hypothetical protein